MKWPEALHIWRNQPSLIKKPSLELVGHIILVLQSRKDFTYLAFKGFLCFNFVYLAVHHIASKSFETFHTSPNNCRLMIKVSFDHLWFSPERLLEVLYGSNIMPLSLMCLNFWKLANIHQMAWNFAHLTESAVVDKKPTLELLEHIIVVLQSPKDFTYLAFKGFLCFNFVYFAVHHIASKSFETFHTSPNNWLLMKKASLCHLWFTPARLLLFPYGSNIMPLSLMSLNFWKYANIHLISWNFVQFTDLAVVDKKP